MLIELDLHGIHHHFVKDMVENFILTNWDKMPLKIICGNSTPMRELVWEVLRKHSLSYYVDGRNLGALIIGK